MEPDAHLAREDVARLQRLKEECRALEQTLQTLAGIEEKKQGLASQVKELTAKKGEVSRQEQVVGQEEASLGLRLRRLQERQGWASLVQIEEAITARRQELAGLEQQLEEKRSLVARLVGMRQGSQDRRSGR